MSYRELRNFKEIMCTLGYPRLISIENFKSPHFELVADVLVWLCQRYDKNMDILSEIRTENDRVAFLKSVAEQLLLKARVKLNLKNLYASNGFAVRELLKVATLLHDAYRNAVTDVDDGDESLPTDIGPGHKFADLKLTRTLSSDITKYGARLHELLASHSETKEAAASALGKNFEVEALQRQLHQLVESATEQTEQMDRMLSNLGQDEQNLQLKIDKKKTELDRHQKRLSSLQTVRPAFMDEFERLERDLSAQYAIYVQSWRNLSYLEGELDNINAQEQERINENDQRLRAMQKRLREEELKILRGQAKVDEQALDEALLAGAAEANRGGGLRAIKRPGAASMRREGRSGGSRDGGNLNESGMAYGSMVPMDEEESESQDEDSGDDQDDDDSGDDDPDGQVEFTNDHGDASDDLQSDEFDGEEEEDFDDGEEDNEF